jgi:hypothetical protein
MAGFGHASAIGADFCIDGWGAGPFVIDAQGKTFRFEDSDMFGPSLVRKNGDIAANPWPSERSPFWRAHWAWVRQGRRLKEDRMTCVYDWPRPTTYFVVGREMFVVERGDAGGEEIRVPPPHKDTPDAQP